MVAGKIAALLAVLSVRGTDARRKARPQIESGADEAEIDRWLGRAARAETLDDVLGR